LVNLKGKVHSEDLGVDGRITLMDLKEIGLEGVDNIHVTQNRDRWRAA
jgi:hypothetical protein